jgi:hypothetical protein
MKKYFIVKNNEKVGPLTIAELIEIGFDKKTLVWYNGLENWINAESEQDLLEFLNGVPPPIPTIQNTMDNKVEIASPIEVHITKKRVDSKATDSGKLRKFFFNIFYELKFLLLCVFVSFIIAFVSYEIFQFANKPILISKENQEQFNEEFDKLNRANHGEFAFGNIYSEYLGFYKFDRKMSTEDLRDINNARISVLKYKAGEFSKIFFYSIFGLIFLARYFIIFIKWQKNQNLKKNHYIALIDKIIG